MAVTGIGGVFVRAKDPKALATWYAEHLGVGAGRYGKWEQQAGTSVFTTFGEDSDYFPTDRRFMLNFRVTDLDAMIATFTGSGIAVVTKPEWNTPGVGRFSRIHDPEGNPFELWEPDAKP